MTFLGVKPTDPLEDFEEWRQQHPTMMEASPGLNCMSQAWRELHGKRNSNPSLVSPEDLSALAASISANEDPAGGVQTYQGEVTIAVDPNNPLHLVAGANHFYSDPNCPRPGGASNDGTQALYGSTDGGATWVYQCAPWPSDINGSVSGAAYYFGSDPALAWDSQGRAYFAYMLVNCNSLQTSCGNSIVVARSTDVGASWQSLGTVVNHSGDSSHGDDKEMMAVDRSPGPASTRSHPGRIYVIWDDLNVERIAYTDNGTTFTTVVLPTPSFGQYDIGGNVVVGPDGTVYTVWNRLTYSGSTQSGEQTAFSKSTDGGSTWSTPVLVATQALLSFGSNNKPPAQNSRGINAFASIDMDTNPASVYYGYIYVSFPDFPGGTTSGTDINTYLVRSTDGGATWSSRLKVNDDSGAATQFFPWLSVDQDDGTVNVAWYDTRVDTTNNRRTQFYYARSTNGGSSFESNILVTDAGGGDWRNSVSYSDENGTDNGSRNGNQYGDYAGIAAINRQVHPFWMDTRNFYPSADTQSPSRLEDAATALIVNCSAPVSLAAPTGATACTAPRVTLSWSAPGWGTNATGGTYSVYRSTTSTFPGGSPLTSGLATTSYNDTTGLPGVTYYYFIVAKNNCPGTALTPMSTTSPASSAIVFPACGTTLGTLQGTVTVGLSPIAGATVTAGVYSTSTDASGFYSFSPIATGTYTVTVTAAGYNSGSASGVVVTNGGTTTQNFSLTPATVSACFTDTSEIDFNAATGTNVDRTISPGNVKLSIVSGGETADQQAQDGSTSGNGMTNTTWWGQTFTPALSGTLSKLSVELFCSGCTGTTSSIVVNINATTGGLPTGAALATATIPAFSSGAGVYYTVTFGSPASVTAGTVYAFTLHASSSISAGTYAVVRTSNNLYGSGQSVTSSTSGSSWSTPTGASKDLEFQTYVTTPYVYQTSGTLVSTTKDAAPVVGASPTWTTLSWTATTPASTTVKFQIAGSNSSSGPFSFVGPDGTASTYFTTSGASLSQFNGNRYLQYKSYLSTTVNTSTPTLSDVTVCYSDVDCSGGSAPTITPSPATVCGGSTGNTASGPGSMSAYSWSITNGTITGGATSQTVTYTAGASGSVGLTLTVTNSGGCQTSNSASVPITSVSTPTASNNGPICAGGTLNLSTPSVGGATYSWTGPNSFSSALQNPSIASATTAATGTYSVTVTVGGCTSATGTTSATVKAVPSTPTASSNSPVCTGSTINLSTPAVAGATYSWTGPNSFSSALQNPSIASVTTASAGTYSLTVTVNGCTSPVGTTIVVVNTTPATPTASSNSPVCSGSTLSLSTPAVPGATYSWTGPNSFSSALQNPSIAGTTTAAAGTYSVTVTSNGCASAAGTTSVVVNATPAAPTASSNSPVCTGSAINLSTPAVAGATYSWTGPNSFSSALQNPSIASVTTASAGTYSLTVTVNGCTSPVGTTIVVVNTTPATPTASSNSPVCSGSTLSLSTPAVPGATYSWTGPGGFTSTSQNPTRASATGAFAGTYSVTVTSNGCTSAAGTTSVVVNTTPATPTATNGGPYCSGSTIQLSTATVSGATYSWTGPNGFSSSLQNPTRASATTADAGSYSVTVTTSGCTSAAGTTSVTVNATPATPTALNDGPICAGGTLNLSTPTVSGATYSWAGPNGFSSATQNPSIAGVTTAASGTYSVTVTVGSCTSAAGSTTAVVNSDTAAPTVTAPAPITVDQTTCCGTFGGVTSAGSAALATFLSGGSATDDCVASPSRLPAQVSATDVTASTCFEVGATTVTFRFQDLAGHIGTATSAATVQMYGDLNLDGVVDPSDMVVLRAYFNFVATPGTPPFNAPLNIADVNHDAVVDPTDSVILRGYLNFAVSCLAP